MKRFIVLVSVLFSLGCVFGEENYIFEDDYAVVCDENFKFGVINKNYEYCIRPVYKSMVNLGEGYFFVCDDTYSKFIIDATGKRLNKEKITRAFHASDGKIPVQGYCDDESGDTRIFDVKTKKIGEILPNLWIFAGFYNGIGCFSTKNSEKTLKVVLRNSAMKPVINMEFDEFLQRDFDTGNWIFAANGKQIIVDKNGRLIQ